MERMTDVSYVLSMLGVHHNGHTRMKLSDGCFEAHQQHQAYWWSSSLWHLGLGTEHYSGLE
jgi:hypothetical protein